MGGDAISRPRAADDVKAIRARMGELRRERERGRSYQHRAGTGQPIRLKYAAR